MKRGRKCEPLEAKSKVIAEQIAHVLFRNGNGEVADRLVLTSKEGRDLGGWCHGAIVDQIRKILLG